MLLNKIFNKYIFLLFILSLTSFNLFSMDKEDDDDDRRIPYFLRQMEQAKTSTANGIKVDTKDDKVKALIHKATDNMPARFTTLFKNKKFKPCILTIKNDSDFNIILNSKDLFFFHLNLPNNKCLQTLAPNRFRMWVNKNVPIYRTFVKKTDNEELLNYLDNKSFNLTIYDKDFLKNKPNLTQEENNNNLLIPKKSIAEFIIFLSNIDWSRLTNKQDRLIPRLNFAIQPPCEN